MNVVTSPARAVILVGHGGVPRDFPREKVRRLMMLERQRHVTGDPMGEEEASLDREIRNHPRTPENDPYREGLERLADALRGKLQVPLFVAYNEFCAPSVPDAARQAIAAGARELVLVSSMMTPGGSHSEEEIPALVEGLRREHPHIRMLYAWPFDLDALASFLVQHLEGCDVAV
jgi:sirohydrochlorin cobaltochelatase